MQIEPSASPRPEIPGRDQQPFKREAHESTCELLLTAGHSGPCTCDVTRCIEASPFGVNCTLGRGHGAYGVGQPAAWYGHANPELAEIGRAHV